MWILQKLFSFLLQKIDLNPNQFLHKILEFHVSFSLKKERKLKFFPRWHKTIISFNQKRFLLQFFFSSKISEKKTTWSSKLIWYNFGLNFRRKKYWHWIRKLINKKLIKKQHWINSFHHLELSPFFLHLLRFTDLLSLYLQT